jgi:predicted small metal-binding protein
MPMTLHCPRCDFVLSAEDEDELVAKVQAHVRKDHGLEHTLPRKHILARLRRQPPNAHPRANMLP